MKKTSDTAKRLTASVISLVAIIICLSITTFAIVYSLVSVDSNFFATGHVKINLNDGYPVVRENDCLMEPGATIKKDFFVENLSSDQVYYKLYFQNVSGGLADVLMVKICDGDQVLVQGTPSQLSRQNVSAFDEALELAQIKTLQIYFHFPETAGNSVQEQTLSFDFVAEAVQVRNNPDKEF